MWLMGRNVKQTLFAVPMTCQSCVKEVSDSLYKLKGISKVEAHLQDQLVSVEGTGMSAPFRWKTPADTHAIGMLRCVRAASEILSRLTFAACSSAVCHSRGYPSHRERRHTARIWGIKQ
jgi:cation transport ATPase